MGRYPTGKLGDLEREGGSWRRFAKMLLDISGGWRDTAWLDRISYLKLPSPPLMLSNINLIDLAGEIFQMNVSLELRKYILTDSFTIHVNIFTIYLQSRTPVRSNSHNSYQSCHHIKAHSAHPQQGPGLRHRDQHLRLGQQPQQLKKMCGSVSSFHASILAGFNL